MAPITMPVLVAGLLTCLILEQTGIFGYGAQLPPKVRMVLEEFEAQENMTTPVSNARLVIQALVFIVLVVGLALHLTAVGLIGLMIIVLLTAFNGIVEEHKLGHALKTLPFTALLVVFFAIVAVIHGQRLFSPVIEAVLASRALMRPAMFFLANGILSMISDNVFVATVYISK